MRKRRLPERPARQLFEVLLYRLQREVRVERGEAAMRDASSRCTIGHIHFSTAATLGACFFIYIFGEQPRLLPAIPRIGEAKCGEEGMDNV